MGQPQQRSSMNHPQNNSLGEIAFGIPAPSMPGAHSLEILPEGDASLTRTGTERPSPDQGPPGPHWEGAPAHRWSVFLGNSSTSVPCPRLGGQGPAALEAGQGPQHHEASAGTWVDVQEPSLLE